MIDSHDDLSIFQAAVQLFAPLRDDARAVERRREPVDPERSYLAQITRISRITQEEETALIARLRAGEAALQKALGGMGFAMNHYVTIGEDIVAGVERLDRFVMERHVADREGFPRLLRSLCVRMRAGIAECGRQYADLMEAVNGHFDAAEDAFGASLAHVQSLVPALCFKQRVNTDLVPILADLVNELSAIETRHRLAPGRPEGVRELREFERRAWMTPGQFRQRAAEARLADAESDAAKRALIEAHLWLVVLLARNYACQGMSFLDLVQEGNMGLMRAAEMYESAGGCRFGSYASWWIRQAITRGIQDQARLIRLPVYLSATASTMLRMQRQLSADFGHEPSTEDIAEEIHLPVDRVRSILGAVQQPVSLQSKVGEGSDAVELGDLIEDTNAASPDETAGRNFLGDRLHELLAPLTEQERMVMTQRYGLNNSTSRTMEEVSREVNLCRQRIQQIEARALKKLRHPVRVRMLNRLLGRGQS